MCTSGTRVAYYSTDQRPKAKKKYVKNRQKPKVKRRTKHTRTYTRTALDIISGDKSTYMVHTKNTMNTKGRIHTIMQTIMRTIRHTIRHKMYTMYTREQ